MATTCSPVQQLIRGTPVLPNPGAVQQIVRETPILPNPSSTMQLLRGTPLNDLGIRGPQIEPFDLQLDRLANITSAVLSITASIDLTTIATTALFTATQKTYVLGVLLRVTTADTVTAVAEASVGVNPSTNNVFANEPLINIDAVDDLYTFWNNTNTGTILNTSQQLDLSVNTGATATTLVATAYVIGVQL